MSGAGRVAMKRQFAIDVQRAADDLIRVKKPKISLPSGTDTSVVESGKRSPAPPSSSKCAPLSPLPEKREAPISKKSAQNVQSVGPYRLLAPLEENSQVFTAVDTRGDGRLVICRRLDRSKYTRMMQISHRLNQTREVNGYDEEASKRAYQQIFPAGSEMVGGDDGYFYYFEPKNFGSLHAHVVERKRLSEQECLRFFRQIIALLVFCHRRGVVLRDLKLRKFVFADPERRTIRLDGIDELFVCSDKSGEDEDEQEQEGQDDKITDRHGCPAYVGPEILDLNQKSYSGRAADVWSLGVLLYVILYGRYPFYDTTPARLFAKIRQAQLHLMEEPGISFEARSLIRCLLRRDPSERPSAMEILAHPWLQSGERTKYAARRLHGISGTVVQTVTGMRMVLREKDTDIDQCVPCVDMEKHDAGKKSKTAKGHRLNVSDEPAVPNQ